MHYRLAPLALWLVSGCATHALREDAMVRAARARLGSPATDADRFVGETLASSGRLALASSGTRDAGWLHALAESDRRLLAGPRAGAVVFFAQARRPFHAGVVEKFDGRHLSFVHAARGQVRRGLCDLDQPGARRDRRGRVANSYLVPRRPDDLPGTRYLCGELVLGYAGF